jgi:Flp pilus assembly protein TadD
MKTVTIICFALALSLPAIARFQSTGQQSDKQATQSSQTTQNDQNQNQRMSGKVSSDGRTFVNDTNNQSYTVSNPETLKGDEGQHVAVVVHVDPDTNTIHIVQLAPPPQL